MKRVLLAAVAGFSVGSVAWAADAPLPASATWSGFYIGVGGGYQWGNFDLTDTRCQGIIGAPPSVPVPCDIGEQFGALNNVELEDQNMFGTLQLGGDWQLGGSFLIGAMVDGTLGKKLTDDKFHYVDWAPPETSPSDGQEWDVSLGNTLTVSGRAGFLPTEETLIYALAGWSWANAETNSAFGCNLGSAPQYCYTDGNSNGYAKNSETIDGLTVGGGIEWMATDHFSIRGEYRYTDFGTLSANGLTSGTALFSELSTETDVTDQSVRLTINWRM